MDFLESLNLLDIGMIVVVLIFSLFGAVKGLMKNIVSLVLAIFAILLAGLLAQKLQKAYINDFIDDKNIAYITSFLIILTCAYLIIFGVMKVLMGKNKERDSILNTIISLFIAIIRFTLIAAIVCSTLKSVEAVTDTQVWENSQLAPRLAKMGDYAYNTKVKMQETNLKDYVPKEVAGS